MFTVLNSVHMLSTSLLWSVTPHVSKHTDSRRQTLLREASNAWHTGDHIISARISALTLEAYKNSTYSVSTLFFFICKHKHELVFLLYIIIFWYLVCTSKIPDWILSVHLQTNYFLHHYWLSWHNLLSILHRISLVR